MKSVWIGDPHIGLVWDGLDRTEEVFTILKNIIKKVPKDITDFFFAGDIFDNSHPFAKHIAQFMGILGEILEGDSSRNVYIIGGNHDGNLESVKGLALEPLSHVHNRDGGQCFIYTEPTIERPSSFESRNGVLMLPYSRTQKEVTIPDVWDSVIGFSHLDIQDAVVGVERFFTKPIPSMLSNSIINNPKVKRIFSGHIHTPQTVGDKIIILGSLLQTDLTEANDKKRFIIYDNKTDEVESIELQNEEFGGSRLKRISFDFVKETPGSGANDFMLNEITKEVKLNDILSIDVRIAEEDLYKIDIGKVESVVAGKVRHLRRIVPIIVKNREVRLPTLNLAVGKQESVKSFVEAYCKEDKELILQKALDIVQDS